VIDYEDIARARDTVGTIDDVEAMMTRLGIDNDSVRRAGYGYEQAAPELPKNEMAAFCSGFIIGAVVMAQKDGTL
jgi:hypothetical protein